MEECLNKYEIEWWYADGHGKEIAWGDDEEQVVARFWSRFKRFLPMAYEKTKVTLLEEDAHAS